MSEVLEFGQNFSTVNVNVPTSNETVIIISNPVDTPYDNATIFVEAFALLQTGTGTTTVVPRIRVGSLATGALISAGQGQALKAAVGTNEPFIDFGSQVVSGVASVQYNLTLTQVSATGNGTVLAAAMLVFVS